MPLHLISCVVGENASALDEGWRVVLRARGPCARRVELTLPHSLLRAPMCEFWLPLTSTNDAMIPPPTARRMFASAIAFGEAVASAAMEGVVYTKRIINAADAQ